MEIVCLEIILSNVILLIRIQYVKMANYIIFLSEENFISFQLNLFLPTKNWIDILDRKRNKRNN
jgi:hypothetical protein